MCLIVTGHGRYSLKLINIVSLTLVLAYGVIAQPRPELPTVGIKEVYLAKDDGAGRAGESADSFSPTDIPIYAVVVLDTAAIVTVKMDLVAADVPGVRADTKVVSTSYTTRNGEDRVNFSGRPAGKWTAGKYRADIFINGRRAKYLVFEIKSASLMVAGSEPFQPRSRPRTIRVSKKN